MNNKQIASKRKIVDKRKLLGFIMSDPDLKAVYSQNR